MILKLSRSAVTPTRFNLCWDVPEQPFNTLRENPDGSLTLDSDESLPAVNGAVGVFTLLAINRCGKFSQNNAARVFRCN